jgi:hypothetical protein
MRRRLPRPRRKADSWDAFPTEKTTDYGGVAKQAGVGVAKGTIGLAGIVGDIQQIAKKVGSYLPDIKPDPESERYARKYGRMGDVMSVGLPRSFRHRMTFRARSRRSRASFASRRTRPRPMPRRWANSCRRR